MNPFCVEKNVLVTYFQLLFVLPYTVRQTMLWTFMALVILSKRACDTELYERIDIRVLSTYYIDKQLS